jgi:photosystem II stability/assembly factor-like uncharacterized protein
LTEVPEFAPDVPDGSVVFIGGTTPLGTASAASAVFRCDRSACGRRALLPELLGPPRVRVSPEFTKTNEIFAWRGERMFRSLDGGATFDGIEVPTTGAFRDVQFGRGTVRYAAAISDASSSGGLLRSTDGGMTWNVLDHRGLESVSVLADGRLLVGLQGKGMACSEDGGESWASRCA